MDVDVFGEAVEFHKHVQEFLGADPAGTTVLATVLNDVVNGARRYPGAGWYLARDDGVVVAAAMHTPPHPLWFSPMPEPAALAITEVALARSPLPTHLAGERRAAETAAERWATLQPQCDPSEVRAMRLYVLDALVPSRPVAGLARLATPDDVDFLIEWWEAFAAEAHSLNTDARSAVTARVAGHGTALVWEVDGEPVSLAGHTAPVAGVARIGPVYSPPSRREQGYGSAVTAACVTHALNAGAEGVVLFTDLANPTSNSIYRQIGFQPVRDYVEIALF